MGKMSFSGILGQASFKQMKKGMGDGFLLLLLREHVWKLLLILAMVWLNEGTENK